MSLRFIRDYFDDEYLRNQELIENLSDDLYTINFKAIKTEDDLIRQVIRQNKGYLRKILSLYEELSKQIPPEGGISVREQEQPSKYLPVHSGISSGKRGGATDSALKDKGKASEDQAKIKYLENKIDYLNNLVSGMKKQLENKNTLQKTQSPETDRINDKIQFLNQAIAELKDQNNQLSAEKIRAESDLQELLSEFSTLKSKYDDEISAKETRNVGTANQTLVDVDYLRALEAQNKKLAEQQEFSERLEDIEKYKEVLAERDRKISSLYLQLDMYRKSGGSPNDRALYATTEMKVAIRNLQKEINELFIKNKISGHQIDLLKDDEATDLDLVAQVQRCSSKIVGLVDAARVLNDHHQAPQSRQSVAGSTREPQSEHTQFSLPRSPHHGIKETYIKTQEEISGALRHSVNQLHQTNYNELAVQLQLQLDKNNELADKIDSLTKHLHSLSLVVNEELQRCLYSVEAVLKIESVHSPSLTLVKADLSRLKNRFQGAFDKTSISFPEHVEQKELRGEYEKQKGFWDDEIRQHKATFEREVAYLKEEIKKEQDLHIQTKRRLEDKNIELTHQVELQAAQHLREASSLKNKIENLEADLNNAKDALNHAQQHLRDAESSAQERDNIIKSHANQIAELEARVSLQENENYQLETELSQSRRENLVLNQKLDEANRVLKDMQRRIEFIEDRAGKMDTDKNQLIHEFAEKRREYEQERNRIEREAEDSRDELRKYTQKTELATKEMKESYNRLIEDYTKQIDQLRTAYEQYKSEKEADLRNKREDLRQLNSKIETLEEASKTQETAVRRRDEQIARLMEEKSHVQERNTELERQLAELASLREKNKKNLEAIAEAKSEINDAKLTNQSISHEKERLEARLIKIEKENDDRRAEVERLKHSMRNSESQHADTQNEIQKLRLQLETERQNVLKKEKEIKQFNESTLVQSKATISYKDELIQRLKEDIKSLTSEYETLRLQYTKLQEKYNDLSHHEPPIKPKETVTEKVSSFRETEPAHQYGDSLFDEIQRMKRDLKRKDEELFQTKRTYKSDVQLYQSKLADTTIKIGSEDVEQRSSGVRLLRKDRDTTNLQ